MIGEFNRRVTIRRWASTQDSGGSNITVAVVDWIVWAKVEDRSGSIDRSQGGEAWSYDYKVTIRYEPSLKIKSNDTIDYGLLADPSTLRLKINSLSIQKEGKRDYYVCRCSTIETQILDTSFTNYVVDKAYYTASGTEPNTFITTDKGALVNKKILAVFKDGVEFFQVAGTPDPLYKQFKYLSSNGRFTFSVNFVDHEHVTIVYGNV